MKALMFFLLFFTSNHLPAKGIELSAGPAWQLVVHGHTPQTFSLREYRQADKSKYYFVQFSRGLRPIAEELVPAAKWSRWKNEIQGSLAQLKAQTDCHEKISWGLGRSAIKLADYCLDGAAKSKMAQLNATLDEMSAYLRRSP